MRNGSPLWLLIPHSSLNGKLMAEEKNESKATFSISKGKALAGILTVLTSAGIGGYYYFQSEEPPPPPKAVVVKEPEPMRGIGFINLNAVRSSLDKDGRLAELTSLETRLKLELKDALKPMLMSPPKVEDKPFEDSVWQKNAQDIISQAAEINKREKQARESYIKEHEAEYLQRRDEANNQFLNEMLNIKLKLRNADNMRLSSAEEVELKERFGELQQKRNLIQKQLKEEWDLEVDTYSKESVKEDRERLNAQAQEAMAKITEEAKQSQANAIERNKTAMEKAMQESKERQDKRQQLMTELQKVSRERIELENNIFDSISDLTAKLAVIHRLEMVVAVKDVRLNAENLWNINNGLSDLSQSPNFNIQSDSANEPLVITSSDAVDLTDELLKELQEQ